MISITPIERFCHWESATPHAEFLRQPINNQWHVYSYHQAGEEIRRIAAALLALQLPHQSNIAILSKNCAHWFMADLAIWMAGHVSVPIYPTLSRAGIQYILEHSDSKAIFIGKLDDFEKQRSGLPDTIHTISFPFYGSNDGVAWNDLLQTQPVTKDVLPSPESFASIMYSSGTTGTPKGIMLTHRAFDFVGKSMAKDFGIAKAERFFSYLPLSHIAEKSYVGMGVLYSGSSISFSESVEKFADNLREVQPTVFGGVPRIFTKFQEGVLAKMPQQKLSLLLSIPILSTIIKKSIRKKMGWGNANIIVCGAAPIPVALLKWYASLGIEIREVYGMTENCGYSHGNHESPPHFGTVGRPWPGIEVKFSEAGEILIKHPGLMTGYYKDAQTTSEVFTADGFLKTGDRGTEDAKGYLTITGRLKDQFKTDKAKFIAPAPIEMKLIANKDIDQVCVVGMGIPQPIALIILSAQAKNKTKEDVAKSLKKSLEELNLSLEHYEHLAKAVILQHDWTIENGLMTPSLKIKRNEVEKIYSEKYGYWYGIKEMIVWE